MERPAEPAGGRRSSRLETAIFAAALALCTAQALWAVRAVDRFPLADGPQHVFLGHLEGVYDDPASGYQRYIESGTPISSRGFTTLFEPLDRLFGWRLALRLTLWAAVLLWIGAFAVLVACLEPRRRWLALLGPATAVQWALYLGFWSFFIATGFGFLVVAWLIRSRELTLRRLAVLAAMLLAQAMMHAFAAQLTGLIVVAVALSRPRPMGALLRVVAAGLPAAALAVASMSGMAPAASANEAFPPTTWLPASESVLRFLGSLATGPVWRGLPVSLLALAGIGAGAALGVAGDRRLGRGLAAAALVLVLAALLCPYHLSTWQYFSPRFVPAGVALGVASLPFERLRSRALTALAAALLGLYSVASNHWATTTNDALARAAEDAMSGLDAPIARTGPRLPVIIDRYLRYDDPEAPWLAIDAFSPAMNLGHLYATEQGGMPPYNFMGTPTLHNFVHRDELPQVYPPVPRFLDWFALSPGPRYPSPERRAEVLTEVARYGRGYEDVILYGAEEDADVLVARGYVPDFRRGGLFLGHFEGCTGELIVEGSVEGVDALVAEYGLVPIPEAEWQERVDVEAAAEPGGVAVPLSRVPCGDLWVRVVWARPPERGGPVFCQGSSPHGALMVEMGPGTRVRCAPEGGD